MPKRKVTKQEPTIAVLKDPIILRQARNQRTISAAFIARFEEHFLEKGQGIFDLMLENFPQLYFASLVNLAKTIRVEAEVTHKEDKPRSIADILQRVEAQTGVTGRRAFEKFLERVQPKTIEHEED